MFSFQYGYNDEEIVGVEILNLICAGITWPLVGRLLVLPALGNYIKLRTRKNIDISLGRILLFTTDYELWVYFYLLMYGNDRSIIKGDII